MFVFQLIVVSDSPSSQYRNRNTLYLMIHVCKVNGIDQFEWLYTEAGHGKGPADGIGATVKRMADTHVARGRNVDAAKDIVALLSDSETKILYKMVSSTL